MLLGRMGGTFPLSCGDSERGVSTVADGQRAMPQPEALVCAGQAQSQHPQGHGQVHPGEDEGCSIVAVGTLRSGTASCPALRFAVSGAG